MSGDRQNKKPSVPLLGTEGAKCAVPPLVRPFLTKRASWSSNKLRRCNGRARPSLLVKRSGGCSEGYSHRFLSPFHQPGALCAENAVLLFLVNAIMKWIIAFIRQVVKGDGAQQQTCRRSERSYFKKRFLFKFSLDFWRFTRYTVLDLYTTDNGR